MTEPTRSIVFRVLDRIFPKAPDFHRLLTEQALQVVHTVTLLVQFMEQATPAVAKQIKADEHAADRLKIHNLHTLNEAFSTPFDREDIYRAIMDLDEVVNYCKSTVNEMDVLGVGPDPYTMEMARALQQGVKALATGFSVLAKQPALSAECADVGRKAERKVEKLYRKALAELFQGEDYLNMFKRREIYRHLSNAADRMAHCSNTLHDIVVKTC
ncbi:MAG: DUF47 domain-containing protein [Betaproteobacteria bacterium HGW-Betaproteobacteria-13]|jgi:hypothetical protein|uniref:Phosphate transport regulator n=1 Tax=Parazoarcus communis TaxID=41977 RepID=A0A2U8H1W3_9RHOO|nr:DUF47 family protein [Parazoarcus communis]AWI79610.1 phosphate transport regulator [Parazoarcus communis]PKO81480.1 MAG: DUF47 domain-containing protein [Betaproteobacteria bacterium HGW-Betaproteobacteria-13]